MSKFPLTKFEKYYTNICRFFGQIRKGVINTPQRINREK